MFFLHSFQNWLKNTLQGLLQIARIRLPVDAYQSKQENAPLTVKITEKLLLNIKILGFEC